MKKKSGTGRPKKTYGSLKKQVNQLTATLEAKFMMSFASASDHKHAGVVETTTQICEDITQYTRKDDEGVIRAPGFTLKQRGYVGDERKHDKEGTHGRTYLNKILKEGGTPRFEGPVTSPGNSKTLENASTFKYVVNGERSRYGTHALPIELVCEQTKLSTVHMTEVVDPALEFARMEISGLKKDNLNLKRKFEAMAQVVESLIAHSKRSDAIQGALIEHGELEFEKSPPVIMLMDVEEVLKQGPPEIGNSAPMPFLAKLSIAKQIGFQGSLDEEEKEPSDKTKYWCFKPKSVQSMGTRWSRQDDEKIMVEEEVITPSPKKTKVAEVIELNTEAPVLSLCGESIFDPFGLENSSPSDRDSIEFDFNDPLDSIFGI